MNKSEITEIKKQFKYTKNGAEALSFDKMRLYYVDASGNVLSNVSKMFLSLDEEEIIKWLDIFKKGICSNAVTKEFPLDEEKSGGIQDGLMKLNDDCLATDALATAFFEKLAENDTLVRNRLYVLIHNAYDVPNKDKDESDEVYSYITGFILPVELEKSGFSFNVKQSEFEIKETKWEIKAPEFAFIFPSFEDRQTDIHKITYFAKKNEPYYSEYVKTMFGLTDVVSKDIQKEAFVQAVSTALTAAHIPDSKKVEAIKAIQENVAEKMNNNDAADSATIAVDEIKTILNNHSISGDTFEQMYKESVPVDNIDASSVMSQTAQYIAAGVKISVDKDVAPQVEIKRIDGQDYITIPVYEGGIEVNGVAL